MFTCCFLTSMFISPHFILLHGYPGISWKILRTFTVCSETEINKNYVFSNGYLEMSLWQEECDFNIVIDFLCKIYIM